MATDSSASTRYRSILPSTASTSRSGDGDAELTGQASPSAPRKRKTIAAACDSCRQRKTLGNAQRMIQLLRSMPYSDSIRMLRLLRDSPESEPPLPTLPSILDPGQFPSQNSLEFELNNRYPVAYPPLFPVRVASLPLPNLLRPIRLPRPPNAEEEPLSPDHQGGSDLTGPGLENCDSPEKPLRPGFMRPLVDNRLYSVDMTYWTDLPISNVLATRAMSLYFELDHPVIPMFNADLFLEDLLRRRTRFCSRFLVTALLAWSFLLYIPFDPQASELSTAFFHGAKSMMNRELKTDSITAIAAIGLLSICATSYGEDKTGVRMLLECIEMGRRMKLLGPSSNTVPPIIREGSGDAKLVRGVSFTIWGMFNWVSLHCLHYKVAVVEAPNPMVPRPDQLEPLLDTNSRTLPVVEASPPVFFASCQLWVIFNDIIRAYYGNRVSRGPSVGLAEDTYRQLLQWANSLPLELARGDQTSHAGTLMHIYLHSIITDVFRPFLQKPWSYQRLASFTSHQAVPAAIYAASVCQLKRLLLHYRQTYEMASKCSALWQTGIIYVSNAMIHESNVTQPNAEWRFYLELCVAGLEDLYGSFRLSRVTVEALLALALQKGALSYADARRTILELEQIGRHHNYGQSGAVTGVKPREHKVLEGAWVMDHALAMEDHEASQADRKAEMLRELMLLDEFTTVVGE